MPRASMTNYTEAEARARLPRVAEDLYRDSAFLLEQHFKYDLEEGEVSPTEGEVKRRLLAAKPVTVSPNGMKQLEEDKLLALIQYLCRYFQWRANEQDEGSFDLTSAYHIRLSIERTYGLLGHVVNLMMCTKMAGRDVFSKGEMEFLARTLSVADDRPKAWVRKEAAHSDTPEKRFLEKLSTYRDRKAALVSRCCPIYFFTDYAREDAKYKVINAAYRYTQGKMSFCNLMQTARDNPRYNKAFFGNSEAESLLHQALKLRGAGPRERLKLELETYISNKVADAKAGGYYSKKFKRIDNVIEATKVAGIQLANGIIDQLLAGRAPKADNVGQLDKYMNENRHFRYSAGTSKAVTLASQVLAQVKVFQAQQRQRQQERSTNVPLQSNSSQPRQSARARLARDL